jgi:hypothetical protein
VHLAAAESMAAVAFTAPFGSGRAVFVDTTFNSGVSWTRTRLGDAATSIDGAPFAVVDGFSVSVLWSESQGGPSVPLLQVSTDGGVTFLATPRAAVPVSSPTYRGGVAASGDSLFVVFHLSFRRSDDRGATWSSPIPIPVQYGSVPFYRSATVAVEPDEILTVTTQTAVFGTMSSYEQSDVSVSEDGGGTWTVNTVGAFQPVVSRDDDSLLVTTGGDPDPLSEGNASFTRFSTDGGQTWSPSRHIAFTYENEFCYRADTSHARFGDTWIVVYRESCAAGSWQILATSSDDAGVSWANPYPLRDAGPTAIPPIAFGFDPASGCAAVAWMEERDGVFGLRVNGGPIDAVDPIACRTGNVDSTLGPPDDVLFLNGLAGDGPERTIDMLASDPFLLSIERPASESENTGDLEYALFFWLTSPSAGTTRILPRTVGGVCMPMAPLPRSGHPAPSERMNAIGYENKIGASTLPAPPGPGVILDDLPFPAPGIGEVRVLVQGLVRNAACPNGSVAVTNALDIRIR